MEILKQYNNNTLELITSGDYEFTSFGEIYVNSYFDLKNVTTNVEDKDTWGTNHYNQYGESAGRGFPKIKISVFTDTNNFIESEILQSQLNDFYVVGNQIFLKPNEYLDRAGFSEDNYNLQFDFIVRFRENNELYISEISSTRQEIRLVVDTNVYEDGFDNNYVNQISGFLNGGNSNGTYQFNSFLELSLGRMIPINSYAIDNVSNNKRTIILKLNQPLPNDINVLTKDFYVSNKFLSSQTENVFFIDREQLSISGLGLEIDELYSTENTSIDDTYTNYNQITSSVGENLVDEIVRQQKDLNLNIDYKTFDGHVHFGSAKSKLENFKTKATTLEGLYNQVSQSLAFSSSLKVTEKRRDLFKQIRKVEDEFTHFEHFMYHDGQSYSTSSAPGIGANLAGRNFVNNVDNNFTTLQRQEGFDKIYKKSNNGFIHLFTDVYNVEETPFYNSNDFFYLSFILRGGGATSEYKLNISGGLANEKYNTQGDSTLGNYPYYNDRQIPFDAFSGSAILNPEVTGSNYRRYIFKAQQNYFRPNQETEASAGVNVRYISGVEEYGENAVDPISGGKTWEILSGSSLTNATTAGNSFARLLLDVTGKYTPYFFPSVINSDGTYNNLNFVTASILSQGDLFPIFTGQSGDKEAFFTDVVVSKNNPTNIHPFSKIYRPPSGSYAGSSEWNDWYSTMESIAEDYDNNNVHSLVNNLPEFLRTDNEHKVLRDFVNMLGEQFDLLRSYIDNYHNIYKLGYTNPNGMPDNLLPIIGNSLGYDLRNPLSGSLENYLESTRGDEVGDKKAIASLWTKILNNLIYIYKTKGTKESIDVLLKLYGYDTDSFNLTEYGGSVDEHNPSIIKNTATNDLENGIKNVTGNVSFVEKTEEIKSLNLSSGSDYLALDWWSNNAEPNGIEFIVRTTRTSGTQTLVRSSGSVDAEDHWDLRIIPSGSSNQVGKLQFRLNNSENADSAIASNAISMSTDYITNINDNKLFNIMLQRQFVTSSYEATSELTQSYHLFVGRKDEDKIKDIQHISMSSLSSFANRNFITSSGQTSNNLLFGQDITGSIAEVRAWDTYISMSKFKQHILNYRSVVGGTATVARDSLVYHYPLNDSPNSSTIKDISSTNKGQSFDKTVSSQPSLTLKSATTNVKNYSLQVRGGKENLKSSKQYNIGKALKSVGGLSDKNANLKQPLKDGTNEPNVEVVNKIGKTYSYTDAINSIVVNFMADFQLDDYLDDYDNNGIYDDLLNLRRQLIQEMGVTIDVVKNLSTVENHTDDTSFIELVEELTPAKTKFEFTYEVANDTLFRPRIKKAALQTQLNPNRAEGSTNLTEPTLNFKYNENVYEKSIDVPSDEFSLSALVNENLKEKSINVLTDELSVTSTANDKVLTNESVPLDIVNLSDSTNQSVFNIEPSNFTNLLLGSKNEFYKNHGKSENQTFFKSGKVGNNGDYNTYKYESRFFFRTIGDIEEFFPVSGTLENRTGKNAKQPFNHHDNFRHFGNRYYVDSGEGYTYNSFFGSDDATVDGRMVGRTLFFKTDTSGNITYPINHYFKVGTSKDSLTNLIYKGTQAGSGKYKTRFDKELDTSPTIPAYTINVGGSDTVKKLKVIR